MADTSVSSLAVTGFGGGTIYYPTSTSDGTFGAVVIAPGFTAYQSSIAWLGPRLASQGFVVFTIDTNTTLDQPDSRGRQLLAALDYLTERSSVRGRIDSSRRPRRHGPLHGRRRHSGGRPVAAVAPGRDPPHPRRAAATADGDDGPSGTPPRPNRPCLPGAPNGPAPCSPRPGTARPPPPYGDAPSWYAA
ncbi:hypothetical protein STENM327S_07380 [Streptomyces tendae]